MLYAIIWLPENKVHYTEKTLNIGTYYCKKKKKKGLTIKI